MRFPKQSAYYGLLSLLIAIPIPLLIFPAALVGPDSLVLLINILFYFFPVIAFIGLFVGIYQRETLGTILCAVMSYIGLRLLLDPLFTRLDLARCSQPGYEVVCPTSTLSLILPLIVLLVIGLAGWLIRRKKTALVTPGTQSTTDQKLGL